MSQVQDLNDNIDELKEVILKLNEPTGPPVNLTPYLLTPRQIAKKILELRSPDAEKKDIHIVVYGKYEVDKSGKVVDNEVKYPWCVDHDRAIKPSHKIFEEIKFMISDVKTSIRTLSVKRTELQNAFKSASKIIIVGITTIATAAIKLPIGSDIPSAILALQNIMLTIENLSHKVLEILPFLDPLFDITSIIIETAVNMILSIVNGIIALLIVVIDTLATLRKMTMPIIEGLKKLGAA